jgi:hypothetical protein
MFTFTVVALFDDNRTSHFQQLIIFTVGILGGLSFIGQFLKKGSIFIVAWEVKGIDAILVTIFSGLLASVSTYCLIKTF